MGEIITDAIMRMAAENAKTVQALEEGVDGLETAVGSQRSLIEAIDGNIGRGVSALGKFADDADSVASSIDSAAAAALRGAGRVDSLASDVGVMAGQVASSDRFLADLTATMDEIAQTAAAIKNAADDLAVISINTAIEAARVGDRGRGFAVIAREVRKLADRSGELSDRIGRSLSEAGNKLGGVRESVGSASASSKSAAESARAFAQEFSAIVDDSTRAEKLVSGFRSVARELLDAEREIQSQVRDIAEAGAEVMRQSRGAAGLAAALRQSTERTLSTISGVRTASHEVALSEAGRLAAGLAGCDLMDRSAVDRTLSSAVAGASAFELLYAMDARGIQVSSNVVKPSCAGKISAEGFGVNRSAKEYFSVPARTGRPYNSAAYLSSASGSLCITVSVPLLDSAGAFRGVLAADFNAGDITGSVSLN